MEKSILIPVIACAVIMVFITGCEKKTEKNKAITRCLFEEVWNQGKLDVIDEIFATDYVGHTAGSPDILGPEDLKQYVTMTCTTFPDLKITVEDQIAEGDKVVTRWTATGTHKPTGVQATWTGISFFRIAGGKIVERWKSMDTLGMMQQLGVIPAPEQGEE